MGKQEFDSHALRKLAVLCMYVNSIGKWTVLCIYANSLGKWTVLCIYVNSVTKFKGRKAILEVLTHT